MVSMIKFATVEYGEIVLYTKHGNSTCYRKPIFEDRAEVITAKQFDEALTEAKKHTETYYYQEGSNKK